MEKMWKVGMVLFYCSVAWNTCTTETKILEEGNGFDMLPGLPSMPLLMPPLPPMQPMQPPLPTMPASLLTNTVKPVVDTLTNEEWTPVTTAVEQIHRLRHGNVECLMEFVKNLHSMQYHQPLRFLLDMAKENSNNRRILVNHETQKKIEESIRGATDAQQIEKTKRFLQEFATQRESRPLIQQRGISGNKTVKMQINTTESKGKNGQSEDVIQHEEILMGPGAIEQPPIGHNYLSLNNQTYVPNQPIGSMALQPQGLFQPGVRNQTIWSTAPQKSPSNVTDTSQTSSGQEYKQKIMEANKAIHDYREEIIMLTMKYAKSLRNLQLEAFLMESAPPSP